MKPLFYISDQLYFLYFIIVFTKVEKEKEKWNLIVHGRLHSIDI